MNDRFSSPVFISASEEKDVEGLPVYLKKNGYGDMLEFEREPELVATLWKGAGEAVRLHSRPKTILKIIRWKARLSRSQEESYRVEHSFFTSGFAARARAGGAVVPLAFLCGEVIQNGKHGRKKKKTKRKRARGSSTDENNRLKLLGCGVRFFALMTDMSVDFPESVIDFSISQARAALKWIARFHATFMGTVAASNRSDSFERDHGCELRGLWSRGCFWTLSRCRPQFEEMERTFSKELNGRLSKEYPELLRKRPGVALLACVYSKSKYF